MGEITIELQDQEAELKKAEAINIIYDLISEPDSFKDFAAKIVAFHEKGLNLSLIETALEKSANLATKISKTPDIELARDVGIIVLGINRRNKVTHTPPGLQDWLGAKYIGDKKGVGWIETNTQTRNVAHVLEINTHDHLPVHKNLRDAFNNGQVTKLVIVHQFTLSPTALAAFQQLYKLTNAEARLCEQLSQGRSVSEAAAISGIKASTNRSHLKKVFSKIGVNSQSTLIRILTQVSAASAIQEFSRQKNIKLDPDWRNGLISQQTLICQTSFGTKLTYSKYGHPNGRPVLFFHCGFGARHHSRRMAEAAKANGILVYKFDRPGFGHSDLLPDMSIKSIAKVTEDLLDHLKIKTIDAIGFGVGGRTLLDCIQFTSGRIKSANLYSFRGVVDGYTGSLMKRLSYLIWNKPKIFMNFIRILRLHSAQGIAAKHLKEYFKDSIADKTYLSDKITLGQMLTEMHLSTRQDFKGSYCEHLNLKKPFPDFNQPVYNIPIKFIYGDLDPFNSTQDNHRIIENIKHAQIINAKGWGQLHITHSLDDFLKLANINLFN